MISEHEDMLQKIVAESLNNFLSSRKIKFPSVTPDQKKRWGEKIMKRIKEALTEENGLFFGNIPVDVEINGPPYL